MSANDAAVTADPAPQSYMTVAPQYGPLSAIQHHASERSQQQTDAQQVPGQNHTMLASVVDSPQGVVQTHHRRQSTFCWTPAADRLLTAQGNRHGASGSGTAEAGSPVLAPSSLRSTCLQPSAIIPRGLRVDILAPAPPRAADVPTVDATSRPASRLGAGLSETTVSSNHDISSQVARLPLEQAGVHRLQVRGTVCS